MASTRLFALKMKHKKLEQEIREEHSHAYCDDFTVRRLKEQKLRLKEEIEKLENVLASAGESLLSAEEDVRAATG